MASPADKPVIVIKKKGGGHGHHGGAWKIAYADFVTAMMAFFLCMWLVNTADSAVKTAIAKYFKKPGVFEIGSGTPLQIGGSGILPEAHAPATREEDDENGVVTRPKKTRFEDSPGETDPNTEMVGKQVEGIKEKKKGGNPYLDESFRTWQDYKMVPLEALIEKFKQKILNLKLPKSLGNISIKVEGEFLKIELLDLPQGGIFYSGSAVIKPEATPILNEITNLLREIPNEFKIVGHTDSKNLLNGTYSNWELSTDRSNAFRQFLFQSGIDEKRLLSVEGVADRQPLQGLPADHPSNRRISLEIKLKPEDIRAPEIEKDFEEKTDASSEVGKIVEPNASEKSLETERLAILDLKKEWRVFDPFEP